MPVPNNPLAWADPSNDNFYADLEKHVLDDKHQWQKLASDELVLHTFTALKRLKRDYETEIARIAVESSARQSECFSMGPSGKQKWFADKRDFDKKRIDLIAKKAKFDDALAIVKPAAMGKNRRDSADMDREAFNRTSGGAADALQQVVLELARAVKSHKDSIRRSGDVPTVADRALWSELARIQFPLRDGELSLRDWLARTETR